MPIFYYDVQPDQPIIIDQIFAPSVSAIDRLKTRDDLEEFFKKVVDKGYVLHGSPICEDILKPHVVKGKNAVYATLRPAIAMWWATVNRAKAQEIYGVTGECRYYRGPHGLVFEAIHEIISTRGDGYVYLCHREFFEGRRGIERCCRGMVAPFARIPVQLSDFHYEVRQIP